MIKISFSFIFALLWSSLYSQELLVTYKKEMKESFSRFKNVDQEIQNTQYQELLDLGTKAALESQKATYSLEINDSVSYFYVNETLLNDSNGEILNNLVNIISDTGNYYQNKSSKQILREIQDQRSKFVGYSYDFYNWRLTKEQDTILGYVCYKAVCTYTESHPMNDSELVRNITAWFTPDLPYYFGPEGFAGVPGLILKKCLENNCFTATTIENRKLQIDWPKGQIISRTEDSENIKKESSFFKN